MVDVRWHAQIQPKRASLERLLRSLELSNGTRPGTAAAASTTAAPVTKATATTSTAATTVTEATTATTASATSTTVTEAL